MATAEKHGHPPPTPNPTFTLADVPITPERLEVKQVMGVTTYEDEIVRCCRGLVDRHERVSLGLALRVFLGGVQT